MAHWKYSFSDGVYFSLRTRDSGDASRLLVGFRGGPIASDRTRDRGVKGCCTRTHEGMWCCLGRNGQRWYTRCEWTFRGPSYESADGWISIIARGLAFRESRYFSARRYSNRSRVRGFRPRRILVILHDTRHGDSLLIEPIPSLILVFIVSSPGMAPRVATQSVISQGILA